MIRLDDLNQYETSLLKDKFQSFMIELEQKIITSNLFINKTDYNEPKYGHHFISKSYEFKKSGIIIRWYDSWDSLQLDIYYSEKKQIVKKTLFGNKIIDENEIFDLWYRPICLEKTKEYYKGYDTFLKYSNNFNITDEDLIFVGLINNLLNSYVSQIKKEDEIRLEELSNRKISLIKDLDKDFNGLVDLIDGESFNKLMTKNQKSIIEIDKNYIQKFVKISMYLKTKKSNTQKIFDSIKDTKNDTELNELVNLLKNQIHTYELLVFHSVSMITSLVDSDLITFYEIYECFDQLGVFNSNWENEVSDKLTNIGDGIRDLMYSIYQMENKIVNSVENLTYVTQDSFKELNISVNNQLSSIDSSIKFNNLLTGIQTYQMYKINQNTKRIN
jgi:hypothetical protein